MKYFNMYLAIAFICCWGLGIAVIALGEKITRFTGELTLMNPVVIVALYSPSIAGLIVYFTSSGWDGVKGVFKKLVPRKQDLIWFPIILGIVALFVVVMHYGSIALSFPLPEMTFTIPQMIVEALRNLIEEAGLIGGVFGWIGFVLPFLQSKFKSNIISALLTGLIFGLWVLPGYIITSFGTSTSYILYVIQLMIFILFTSYIFNVTKGNLLIYIFLFWLIASGSRLKFYFFNAQVQFLQIAYFLLATIVIHMIFKKRKIRQELQVFPSFIAE